MKHISRMLPALVLALFSGIFANRAVADETLNIGAHVPTAEDVRQGLFPEDECEQLRAAGFKCMGFKPAVKFSLPAIAFKRGSAELPDGLKKQLDVFADVLRARQSAEQKVRVEGHADASGDPATNLELSQRRAEAAREYLLGKGVNGELMVAVGVGSNDLMDRSNPLAADNRRVVIGRQAGEH